VNPETLRTNSVRLPKLSVREQTFNASLETSLVYDFDIGRLLYDPFIEVLERFGVDKKKARDGIREIFCRYAKDDPFLDEEVRWKGQLEWRRPERTGVLPKYRCLL
jgi:hypothetical protein